MSLESIGFTSFVRALQSLNVQKHMLSKSINELFFLRAKDPHHHFFEHVTRCLHKNPDLSSSVSEIETLLCFYQQINQK
jgi:hypothetical protein